MPDIISLLKKDHEKVKGLFNQFESVKEKEPSRLDAIIQEAIRELEAHSEIEKKLVYPLIQQEEEIFNEAMEEHHVVDLLIGELKKMKSSGDGRLVAKFEVLAENVRHHIKEEESELFPKLKKADADLEEIGDEAESMKMELIGQAQGTAGVGLGAGRANRGGGKANRGTDGGGVRLEDDEEEEDEGEEEEEEAEDEGARPSVRSSRGSTGGRADTKSSRSSTGGARSERAPARSSTSRGAGRSSGRSSSSGGGSASTTGRSSAGSSGGSRSGKSSGTSARSAKATTKRKSSSSR